MAQEIAKEDRFGFIKTEMGFKERKVVIKMEKDSQQEGERELWNTDSGHG